MKNSQPVKLEALVPKLDERKPDSILLHGELSSNYNPEIVEIPRSGWSQAYDVGRKLFIAGDYCRALHAFQMAAEASEDFGDQDPRRVMSSKAIASARARITLRSELGYDTDSSNSRALTGRVTRVFPPSLAWLAGLNKNDVVLKATVKGTGFLLNVKRQGKPFMVRLKLEESKTERQPLRAHAGKSNRQPLTGAGKILAEYDCTLLLDISGSMHGKLTAALDEQQDEFVEDTKWSWCREQTRSYYNTSSECFPNGINLIPFNHQFSFTGHARMKEIAEVYSMEPWGCTDIAGPLNYALERYFSHRGKAGAEKRPVAISVITDGLSAVRPIAEVIIKATKRMSSSSEVVITFLSIGKDRVETLDILDNRLVNAGAAYDIVTVYSIEQCKQLGLKEAIVRSLTAARSSSGEARNKIDPFADGA